MSAGFTPPARLAWLQALHQPALVLAWSLPQWQQVVRLARRLRLLARLAEAVAAAGLMDQVPGPARRHLVAEQHRSRARIAVVCWTIERCADVLADAVYPKVLLKGAAYIAQGLPIAQGRLPSDLDVLVPPAHIADAQARLKAAGWAEPALDEHDQRFYREWAHEVPPMSHPVLPVELDLHHNILPPVGHAPVDAALLLARLAPSRLAGWQVLDPVDQVLHSAAHLFFDAELQDRVRDLVDLDGLLRHFSAAPGFWGRLQARAAELGLGEPLALACDFTTGWLGTPVPADVLARIRQAGPGVVQRAWLMPLMRHVLMPASPEHGRQPTQELAAAALLARHHWRRLPLRLLVPHLWHKWQVARRAALNAADLPPAAQ